MTTYTAEEVSTMIGIANLFSAGAALLAVDFAGGNATEVGLICLDVAGVSTLFHILGWYVKRTYGVEE